MRHWKFFEAGRRNAGLLLALALFLLCGGCGQREAADAGGRPAEQETAEGSATRSPAEESPRTLEPEALPNPSYLDVPEDAWYAGAVAEVTERGLMRGVGEDHFSPEGSFTRAQLATVLYRLADAPEVAGYDGFSDTEPDAWYAAPVLWAVQRGIVNGVGGGRFAPEDPVTQEQLVTMLWRLEGEPAAEEASDASPYAARAVGWARAAGIAPETEDYSFSPGAEAVRAQVAALLTEYLSATEQAVRASAPAMAEAGEVAVEKETLQTAGAEVALSALAHRTDNTSAPAVYFSSSLSSEGLQAVYDALEWSPSGKVAVKVSTGEPPASNYLRADLIGDLVQSLSGTVVECNTAYGGSRASAALHRQVAEDHGFTSFAEFDLLDEEGEAAWPVTGGTRLDRAIVGSHAENYDDWLILSHFKGHGMAGFGGAIKNVAIGISSPSGKVYVHTAGTRTSGNIYHYDQDAWLEALPEMVSGVRDHVGEAHIIYINVMNRLSVDCDCNGYPAEPDMHDVGILASTDPVALDQACVDLVYAVPDGGSLIQRMEGLNGTHTLEHGEEIGLGSREYRLLCVDG